MIIAIFISQREHFSSNRHSLNAARVLVRFVNRNDRWYDSLEALELNKRTPSRLLCSLHDDTRLITQINQLIALSLRSGTSVEYGRALPHQFFLVG